MIANDFPLIMLLRNKDIHKDYGTAQWSEVLRLARAEKMLGTIAHLLSPHWHSLPFSTRDILREGQVLARFSTTRIGWEVKQIGQALRPLDERVILLKGAAYLISDMPFGSGRICSDVDLMVSAQKLSDAEELLYKAGWRIHQEKDNPYDQHYYRAWMHELPPMSHPERGVEIDLHHTLIPPTARIKPKAEALFEAAVPIGDSGFYRLCDCDMILHTAAHSFSDGAFDLPIRSLWDLHQMIVHFHKTPLFWERLHERAQLHDLERPLAYALNLSNKLFEILPIPQFIDKMVRSALPSFTQNLVVDRLLTGRALELSSYHLRSKIIRRALTIRSHLIKMPPGMLIKHLFTKWRMRSTSQADAGQSE